MGEGINMTLEVKKHYQKIIDSIKEEGLFKNERVIGSPQRAHIKAVNKEVLNMCANNYLGLADNKEIIEAARKSYEAWGYGLSSVRFICGTQEIHKELEKKIAEFLGTEDSILYTCLLYTSDAADEEDSVDLGGRRIIKKKKK